MLDRTSRFGAEIGTEIVPGNASTHKRRGDAVWVRIEICVVRTAYVHVVSFVAVAY